VTTATSGRRRKGGVLAALGSRLTSQLTYSQWYPLVTTAAEIAPDWSNLTPLLPPDRRTWADPFPLRHNGLWHLFVEEKPVGQHGHIAVLELDPELRLRSAQVVLKRPWHLSYPFLLQFQGELFMIPEAGASGRVDVYRCTHFPDQWVHHATLLAGVRAADPTLLEHQGRWWLFATVDAAAGTSRGRAVEGCPDPTRQELHLFYADTPLSTEWTPHPLNPVVSDRRCARPAGRLYRESGQLLRPAQDCSVRYGYAVRVQRVLQLDTQTYREEEALALLPRRGTARATHTLNREAGLTVIDAKRRRLRCWG
jgi:hypothetical protein